MFKEEGLEEPELSYDIVRTSCCLLTLKTSNADTNMCCCDHIHIISTISDRKGDLIRELIADHLHDISLLLRRHSAGKDDVDFDPNVKKLIFKCIVRKDYT